MGSCALQKFLNCFNGLPIVKRFLVEAAVANMISYRCFFFLL
jgi:hypothetical protein